MTLYELGCLYDEQAANVAEMIKHTTLKMENADELPAGCIDGLRRYRNDLYAIRADLLETAEKLKNYYAQEAGT